MSFALKTCKCGNEFRQYNSLTRYCSFKCSNFYGKPPDLKLKTVYKPIRNKSIKRQSQELQYLSDRIIFLSKPENKICPVTGQPATEVHHVRKRRGYADEWARLNNIPLLLDQRFWLAVSRDGHNKIENEPEWAYEKGYSIRNNSKKL